MVPRVQLSTLMVTALLLTVSFGKSAQGQDTDPLCYFTDAAGNRRDLSAWCGRPGNNPTDPSSAPASAPMGPPPAATSANGGGNVELLQCRVEAERRTEQAGPSQRLIVHLMGSVQNQTGRPVNNVTVRYVVKSESSILSRDGRSLNESLLGVGDRGMFDRKDKPIALEAVTSSNSRWQIEIEAIDWVEAGMARSRQLSPPTRCY